MLTQKTLLLLHQERVAGLHSPVWWQIIFHACIWLTLMVLNVFLCLYILKTSYLATIQTCFLMLSRIVVWPEKTRLPMKVWNISMMLIRGRLSPKKTYSIMSTGFCTLQNIGNGMVIPLEKNCHAFLVWRHMSLLRHSLILAEGLGRCTSILIHNPFIRVWKSTQGTKTWHLKIIGWHRWNMARGRIKASCTIMNALQCQAFPLKLMIMWWMANLHWIGWLNVNASKQTKPVALWTMPMIGLSRPCTTHVTHWNCFCGLLPSALKPWRL